MTNIISEFKVKTNDTKEWLINELTKVRTGRAAPSFLDSVKVDSYGSMMLLNQVASVNSEDAKTLRVAPWDTSMINPIDKAITNADLGVSTSTDDKGVRVHFPDLTAETREKIAKSAKQKHEDARIALRGVRDEYRTLIQTKQKSGELSEDQSKRMLAEIDELTGQVNKEFDQLYQSKYDELTTL